MKKKRKISYQRLPHQRAFHNSIKSKVHMSGGWGSGKTYALCMKMFQLMQANYGLPGGILVPSYKSYKRDLMPELKGICEANKIRTSYNKSDFIWTFPDTKSTVYVFHSTPDGDGIKGPNLAWFIANELNLCDKMSYLACLGRIRLREAKLPQMASSGAPEGFDWCYEYFLEEQRQDSDVVFASSRDNPHLSSSYVQMLESSYDPLMVKQYVDGIPVNLNKAACLYAFNRKLHVGDVPRLENYPIWVSLDFNVAPMAATIYNRVPFAKVNRTGYEAYTHQLRAWDEVCIQSSNTNELCHVLKEKLMLPNGTIPMSDVTIYPDPAGASRSTKSNMSDIDILKEHGFKNIRYKTRLSVRDCLNAANAFVSKDMLIVDKKCKNFIQDAEQCVFKEGAFEIDKSNPNRTHWLDGFKNMVDYEFPVGGRRAHRIEKYI